MTRPRGADPVIPDAVQPLWDELTTEAIPARENAVVELERANRRCRELLAGLLRGGVRRGALEGRPYSQSRLTQIQHEEGLIGPRRTDR